jgi:hypothetical protein
MRMEDRSLSFILVSSSDLEGRGGFLTNSLSEGFMWGTKPEYVC